MSTLLWQPTPEAVAATRLTAFARYAETSAGAPRCPDYATLHRWSVECPDAFWRAIWNFCHVVGEGPLEIACATGDGIRDARWFPEARLNFAENLLQQRGNTPALIAIAEDGGRREISCDALRIQVASLAECFREFGVVAGDRVAGVLPNGPEAVVAMLAATSLGAIWSSCSPDFGVRGIVDRFGQIGCKILIATDVYQYGGKIFETLKHLPQILKDLPSVEQTIVVQFGRTAPNLDSLPHSHVFEALVSKHDQTALVFTRLPFDHPIAILYSSGTTGKPKCIVHGAGGTLLQHLKEHQLHCDIRPRDRLFYYTTCGWMMWNWLVSGLASEATLVLYDGSPFHPDGGRLFSLVEQERIKVFGVSAKFLDSAAKANLQPGREFDLSSLSAILSTGSPLVDESFDYVYRAIGSDLQLSSISGGTDIVSCFVLGNPNLPVHRGEIQSAGLGMAVEVFDEDGRATRQEEGELVCLRPFPSRPVKFWNDDDGARYRAAYFERFPGVWCHGDWIRRTPNDGFVISGRSDAVLNPGGVRIGTAEIYRQIQRLDWVIEGLAVAQEWQGDVRIILFVTLRDGIELDDERRDAIRAIIRRHASPRHVPARVLQVPDIPRTRSGKITELAVRDLIHGRTVKNAEALANPEALEHFANRPELE